MTDAKPLPSQPDQPSMKVSGSLVRSLPTSTAPRAMHLIIRCHAFHLPQLWLCRISNWQRSQRSRNKERKSDEEERVEQTLSFSLGVNSHPDEKCLLPAHANTIKQLVICILTDMEEWFKNLP